MMDILVDEVLPAWVPPAPKPKAREPQPFALAHLSANPLAAGVARAVAEPQQLPMVPERLVATDGDDAHEEVHVAGAGVVAEEGLRYCDGGNSSGSEAGGCDNDHSKNDVVDAIHEVMEEASGGALTPLDGALLDPAAEPEAAGTPGVSEEEESDADCESLSLDAARAAGADEVPDPREAVESARISEAGYVSTRVLPWVTLVPTCGRITTFPKTPEIQQMTNE